MYSAVEVSHHGSLITSLSIYQLLRHFQHIKVLFFLKKKRKCQIININITLYWKWRVSINLCQLPGKNNEIIHGLEVYRTQEIKMHVCF